MEDSVTKASVFWRALPIIVSSFWLTGFAAAQQEPNDAYRKILQLWSRGAEHEALDRLVDFEHSWVDRLERLERLQVAEMSRLARNDRWSLVAVARLHQRAFGGYRSQSLLGHCVKLNNRAMSKLVKADREDSQGRKTAAVMLTSMAVTLRNSRYVDSAAEHLRKATTLDPEITEALEWGGSAAEELGRLDRAADLFGRLVELDPDNTPARLRLAMVNAKRGGDSSEELETIARSDHRSWAWIFAIEELARIYRESGRATEAAEWLGRAWDEYPSDQGLAVASSYTSRSDRPASRAVLEALEARPRRSSARVHYGQWFGQQEFDARVEASVLESLPRLGVALRSTEQDR